MTRPSLLPAFIAAVVLASVLWRLETVWTATAGWRDRAESLLLMLLVVAR